MNISALYGDGSVALDYECIHGIAYKNTAAGARCAHLPNLCANFGLLRNYCAHFCRMEYLSPHSRTAWRKASLA